MSTGAGPPSLAATNATLALTLVFPNPRPCRSLLPPHSAEMGRLGLVDKGPKGRHLDRDPSLLLMALARVRLPDGFSMSIAISGWFLPSS